MITSAQSFQSNANRQEAVEFEVDTQYIVPGKYTMNIILYEINQFGTYRNCDGIKDVYCFEIKDTNNKYGKYEWSHRYWGHVSLHDVEITSAPLD